MCKQWSFILRRISFSLFPFILKKITLVNPPWEDSFAAVLFRGYSKRNCICSSQRMKLNLLRPDELLLLYPAHFWERLLRAIGDSALNVLAPALAHEGTGTDLGPRSSQMRIGSCVECLCGCVCLLSEVSLLEGETSNTSLCLLIEVETACRSVIYLYVLRKIMVLERIGQSKDTHFQLASSHVQNIVRC